MNNYSTPPNGVGFDTVFCAVIVTNVYVATVGIVWRYTMCGIGITHTFGALLYPGITPKTNY